MSTASSMIKTAFSQRLGDEIVLYKLIRMDEREMSTTSADDDGVTPLHLAVAYRYPQACQWLLGKGADLTARTTNGKGIEDFGGVAAQRTSKGMGLYLHTLYRNRSAYSGPSSSGCTNPSHILDCGPQPSVRAVGTTFETETSRSSGWTIFVSFPGFEFGWWSSWRNDQKLSM